MDITHLHLHVRDRPRSAAFYRRWFGLREVAKGEDITFVSGAREFLFALMEDPAPAPMPAWFHFGIRLDSAAEVRALLDAMNAAHVPIVKPLLLSETLVSFRCADPDAYPIEVYWSPGTA
jgi:catechol 2,3-dioxygenase-like lactoylglutathione lyase family enzyme